MTHTKYIDTNRARGIKPVAIILVVSLVFLFSPALLLTDSVYGADNDVQEDALISDLGVDKAVSQQDLVIAAAMSKLGKTSGYFGFGGGGWCTKYVNWAMKQAGIANNSNYPAGGLGSSRDFAVYYAKKGAYTAIYSAASVGYKTKVNKDYVPKRGDIAIFSYGPGGYIHHVGLVMSVKMGANGKAKSVKIVHGNWCGRVSVTTFKMYGTTWAETIVGYCTPNYTINVTFDPNGGSVSKKRMTTSNDKKYGKLPVPTREGYKFEGWYTKSKGGALITAKTKVSTNSSHILYAHWSKISIPKPPDDEDISLE